MPFLEQNIACTAGLFSIMLTDHRELHVFIHHAAGGSARIFWYQVQYLEEDLNMDFS
jgi:hypothetical protein